MGITKFVLKRPVTVIMCLLAIIVFGGNAITGMKVEQMPEISMPMLIVYDTYVGATPEDVDELIIDPIEDAVGTLEGVDSISSQAMEHYGLTILSYDYEVNIDDAYNDLRKALDHAVLPEDAEEPTIIELNMDEMASLNLVVENSGQDNMYNYVDSLIVPELEKLTSVASINVTGGQQEYLSVSVSRERLQQYNLSIDTLISLIGAADISFPLGETEVGNQTLTVTGGIDVSDADALRNLPITLGSGAVVRLGDIANVTPALEKESSISRYDGRDTVSVSIVKQQSASALELTHDVEKVIEKLQKNDPQLSVLTVYSASDTIVHNLKQVLSSLAVAVVASMVIIFLFFGDFKASLIVGCSMPTSVLVSFVMMSIAGFSINVITLGALVLGVGMIVDASIVVLESSFRRFEAIATEGKVPTHKEYIEIALGGCKEVLASISGGVVTTCVVFVPLTMTGGMSGQIFHPLGLTIVFCLLASLLSAISIVPLCYVFYKPTERFNAPANGPVKRFQAKYRSFIPKFVRHRKRVMLISVILLASAVGIGFLLPSELIELDGTNTVVISVDTQPGLSLDSTDEILQKVEAMIADDENVSHYLLTYGGSNSMLTGGGNTLTAYLNDGAKLNAKELIDKWKPMLTKIPDCTISMEEGNIMGMEISLPTYLSVDLQSTQYDELKARSDEMVEYLRSREEVYSVHSTLENDAPIIKLELDPQLTAARGLVPAQVLAAVNSLIGGTEATTLDVDGKSISVMVEYTNDPYAKLDDLKNIVLTNAYGMAVPISEIGKFVYADSPVAIARQDKQYIVTVTAEYQPDVKSSTKNALVDELEARFVYGNVALGENAIESMMYEEFAGLLKAIFIATFLVFAVMSAQFESVRFSLMVMTTVPLSLIGSFYFMLISWTSFSIVSIFGFLMLIGMVVNNGILYVDAVNMCRTEYGMTAEEAVVEAGVIRIRPILMTSFTTIIGMVPMAIGLGGITMQGLAVTMVGGMVASTLMSLIVLPAYYMLMDKRAPRRKKAAKAGKRSFFNKKNKATEEVAPDAEHVFN